MLLLEAGQRLAKGNAASRDATNPLVSCEWLQEKITSGNTGGVVVLDVSWSSQKDCYQDFKERHIKGARHLNVMAGPHTELFPRNLPPPEAFQEAARSVGVNNNSHVILYSDSDVCGFFMSGRAWWTFKVFGARKVSILNGGLQKWMSLGYLTTSDATDVQVFGARKVSILNGGLQKWMSLGYLTTSDATDVQVGAFTAKCENHYRRTFEDMESRVESGACILDSRAVERYSAGHLPGAKNLPYSLLVDHDKQEMSVDSTRKALAKLGVDMSQSLTTYCNSGMSSCTLAFALHLCGATDFAVYHGGFTEWKDKAKEKIETS